ncbi:MAG: nucleoside-diphosphate sugar epimerase/dehydratase [Vicingaceae bacterium]
MISSLLFKSNTPRWIIFLIDLGIVAFAAFMAYILRFNFAIPDSEIPLIKFAVVSIFLSRILLFVIGKTYTGIIRYTSTEDARKILIVNFIGSVLIGLNNLISFYLIGIYAVPFSIVILEFLLTSSIMIFSRSLVKMIYDEFKNPAADRNPILIFGAGEAGMIAKRTIDRDTKSNFNVVGFVDDDKKKSKRKLENKPIYYSNELDQVLESNSISHLIVSIQNISKLRLQEIVETCLAHNVQVLNVPSASSWINGELSVKQIRQIKIEDLLGRSPIELSVKTIEQQLNGKVVLISGAGGSIGSELVRQVVKFAPKKVLLLDQAESDLYDLEMELSSNKNASCTELVIGDVTNLQRMKKVFSFFQPEIVYHAAAYKHVPLMEKNPAEAISTNIVGSKIMADLSVEFGVQSFVMVSTDKAVNPTNVMGATKRVAEIYIQSLNKTAKTNFITTRFGNVLGSNGSVIPLFKKQIESGGPITVTHPEITRYFMTIPEACQLVLEAGSAGKGGEVFIFDMGKSIKIKDLASQMIQLSGLEEGKDIQIVYTQLRPGEKLYEELLNNKENTLPTHHPQIMIARVEETKYDTINTIVNQLSADLTEKTNEDLVWTLKQLVPEYKSNNSVFEALD